MWTHFSLFEDVDNITQAEVAELEGLSDISIEKIVAQSNQQAAFLQETQNG